MLNYLTLDNINVEGKIVCLRVDLDSPVINKEVTLSERIIKACNTIEELVKKQARIIIIGHQGRKNSSSFCSLKKHKELIETKLKTKIQFSKEIYSENVEKKIKNLKIGEIILLENLRTIDDETNFTNIKKEDNKIQKLANLCDFYILDAFSTSHRDNYSISQIQDKEIVCGRTFEYELKHLEKIKNTKSPHIFVLGGNKPKDLISLMDTSLKNKKADKILLTGIIGELALISLDYNLGIKHEKLIEKYFEEISELKRLLTKYPKKIFYPKDIVLFDEKQRIEILIDNLAKNKELLEKFEPMDIGTETINDYEKIINKSCSLYLKGPCGNFENINFEKGTYELFSIIAKSKTYSFMGGGHTVTAAKMFNLLHKFSYVSLAGGALAKYIQKEKLYGIELLEKSFREYENIYYDFIVVGSNVLDIKVDVPFKFNQIELGSKINIKDNFKMNFGGGGVNLSLCLSKFKTKIGYLGKISNEFKEMLLDELQKNKIGLIKSEETKRAVAKSIILQTKDKDRVILYYKGQGQFLEKNDFDFKDLKGNNFIFTSLIGKSFKTLLYLAKKIKKKNKNSKICYVLGSSLIEKEMKLKSLLNLVDVVIMNFEEAKMLTSKREVSQCLKEIANLGIKCIIITDGSQGSYAYVNGKEYFQKSFLPRRIVDTTGAGDCFAGTFFYFYTKGYKVQESLRVASLNSSSLITKNGTQNGLLGFNELTSKKN
jgi:phosphoglycerate kinase